MKTTIESLPPVCQSAVNALQIRHFFYFIIRALLVSNVWLVPAFLSVSKAQTCPTDYRGSADYDSGKRLYDAGNYQGAIKYLNRSAKISPSGLKAKPLTLLATIYMDHNEYESANILLERALQDNSNYGPAHLKRGNIAKEVRVFDVAEREYREAIRICKYQAAYALLAEVLQMRGMNSQANTVVDAGLKVHPRDPYLMALKSYTTFQAGRYQEAIREFDLAYPDAPRSDWLKLLRGAILLELARLEEAKIEFEKVIKSSPEMAESHQLLAKFHLKKKEYRLAITEIDKALGLSDKYNKRSILVTKGWIDFYRGAYDLGLLSAQQAIELDSTTYDSHILLMALHLYAPHFEEAISEIQYLQKLQPNDQIFKYYEALCYYKKQEYGIASSKLYKFTTPKFTAVRDSVDGLHGLITHRLYSGEMPADQAVEVINNMIMNDKTVDQKLLLYLYPEISFR